jgi:hypothetical protein
MNNKSYKIDFTDSNKEDDDLKVRGSHKIKNLPNTKVVKCYICGKYATEAQKLKSTKCVIKSD